MFRRSAAGERGGDDAAPRRFPAKMLRLALRGLRGADVGGVDKGAGRVVFGGTRKRGTLRAMVSSQWLYIYIYINIYINVYSYIFVRIT